MCACEPSIDLATNEGLLHNIDHYEYKGCYVDDSNRDMELVVGTGYNMATCSTACAAYKFMALQNNGECNCGNEYGSDATESTPMYLKLIFDSSV